jgi:alanine racemase
MRPKLAEVALRADVSEATVSRVLNARPGVAPGTRRKVLDVLSDLGYRDVPEKAASSGVVGIVTPELENPIFPLLAQTIESRLAHHGMLSVVCSSTAETVHEQDFLDHLTAINAAGVVVINGRYAMPDVGFNPYRELWQQGTPIVLVNGLHQRAPLPAVAIDLATAAGMGVDHLATLGHDRIGLLIGPRRYSSALAMIDGFERGLAERGFDGDGGLVSETLFTFEGGQAGMATLLEGGVTGIIAGSDLMALGAIAAVRSWGASVPEDVSVIGFDGTPAMAFTDPPLTTLRQPVGRMAAAIATMLVAQMNGDRQVQTQVFRPELVVGQTTAPAPAHV